MLVGCLYRKTSLSHHNNKTFMVWVKGHVDCTLYTGRSVPPFQSSFACIAPCVPAASMPTGTEISDLRCEFSSQPCCTACTWMFLAGTDAISHALPPLVIVYPPTTAASSYCIHFLLLWACTGHSTKYLVLISCIRMAVVSSYPRISMPRFLDSVVPTFTALSKTRRCRSQTVIAMWRPCLFTAWYSVVKTTQLQESLHQFGATCACIPAINAIQRGLQHYKLVTNALEIRKCDSNGTC